MKNTHRTLLSALVASVLSMTALTAAQAADVYLRAESFVKAIPSDAAGTATQPVTMWGYSACDAGFANCSAPSSPGPEITVPPGDTSLTIHLQNQLPEATSLMIPGQTKAMTPQTFTGGDGRQRIRAFDVEAPASGGTRDYAWSDLRPGTYLYQSGSHVQLQVQMGLYGAMVHDAEMIPPADPPAEVAIQNASFESPDCSAGAPCTVDALRGNWTTSATGWTVTGVAGVFRPISSGPPGIAPTDGDQVGFSNGGTLAQVLTGTVVAADTVYTLTVDVGDRADSGFPGYTLGLYAGGALLAQYAGAASSVTTGWTTSTVTYVSGATPPAGDLEIRLTSAGGQTEFDNVRLTAGEAVPCMTAPCAYSGVEYDRSKVILFSEIDPALHDPAPTPANLTVDGYRPRYFLLNGEPFVAARAVNLVNAGFEDPDCDTATCIVDAVRGNYATSATGWTVAGGAGGVFAPLAAIIAPTEGDQVGWSSGATLSQVLAETPVAGTTYTLSVDVGDRTDAAFPGYTVALYAGGAPLVQQAGASGSVTNGWTTATVTYTATGSETGPLEIRLSSAGSQTEFDNVRLFASQATSAPAVAGSADLLTAAPGERLLLRLLNAGLQNRAPQLLGGYFEIVAEDGHTAPVRRRQYNTLLPAGKSLDVLFVPGAEGTYALYDRRLGLVNGSATQGGQLGHIVVAAP